MTVMALVPGGTGNVVYVWYINGESVETGESYAAGYYHSLAIKNDGTLRAWNANGQLGDGTTTPRLSPVQVLFP
ncbi:MAG TPA: hypothetical protein ENI06_10435 [Spirochaetales bacterium]|nr:hypothetical protein [Spirochaetales bacterium]